MNVHSFIFVSVNGAAFDNILKFSCSHLSLSSTYCISVDRIDILNCNLVFQMHSCFISRMKKSEAGSRVSL